MATSTWQTGLSNILDAFGADTGLSHLGTAITNWWDGTTGSPLAPLGDLDLADGP